MLLVPVLCAAWQCVLGGLEGSHSDGCNCFVNFCLFLMFFLSVSSSSHFLYASVWHEGGICVIQYMFSWVWYVFECMHACCFGGFGMHLWWKGCCFFVFFDKMLNVRFLFVSNINKFNVQALLFLMEITVLENHYTQYVQKIKLIKYYILHSNHKISCRKWAGQNSLNLIYN